MRGMKYIQFHVGPKASLVWNPGKPHLLLHQNTFIYVCAFGPCWAEVLRSRYRERPSTPPWWCTGKQWAQQTGCCRTAWCRRWGRSRCRCTRSWTDTFWLRRRTPTLTSPQFRFLQTRREHSDCDGFLTNLFFKPPFPVVTFKLGFKNWYKWTKYVDHLFIFQCEFVAWTSSGKQGMQPRPTSIIKNKSC